MSSSDRSRRRLLAAAAGGLLLGGCGFELRRPPVFAFKTIALTGFAPRSPLAEQLKRSLTPTVKIVDNPAQAEVVLHARVDQRVKSVVASTSAAQVREFQLRLKLDYSARTSAGRELIAPNELVLTRDLNYSETAALAKEQEEAELYREMQDDVVMQVLRRLGSITL